mgnify:CR=1 FL=1
MPRSIKLVHNAGGATGVATDPMLHDETEESVDVRLGGRREHLRHVLRDGQVEAQAVAVELDRADAAVFLDSWVRERTVAPSADHESGVGGGCACHCCFGL